MKAINLIPQILPFLLTILSSFLIAYITSRLCFWLYGKIRAWLKISDEGKILPEDVKKWQLFVLSMGAYVLPSVVFGFFQKDNAQMGWLIGAGGLVFLMEFIMLLKQGVRKKEVAIV